MFHSLPGYFLLIHITAHILVTIVPSMYAVTYIASDVYCPPGKAY